MYYFLVIIYLYGIKLMLFVYKVPYQKMIFKNYTIRKIMFF